MPRQRPAQRELDHRRERARAEENDGGAMSARARGVGVVELVDQLRASIDEAERQLDDRPDRSRLDQVRTFTIDELADRLGLSARSIQRQLAAGTFPITPIQGLGSGMKHKLRRWSPYVVEA